MTSFRNKNILITGGASGIGRLMGKYMAQKGGTIILWDINKKALKENGGKRFYTKRLKKKNLKPMNETQRSIVKRSKHQKLLKLQTKQ